MNETISTPKADDVVLDALKDGPVKLAFLYERVSKSGASTASLYDILCGLSDAGTIRMFNSAGPRVVRMVELASPTTAVGDAR